MPWVFLVLGLLALAYPSITEFAALRQNTVTITDYRASRLTPEQEAARRHAIVEYEASLAGGRFYTVTDPFAGDAVRATNSYLATGELLFVSHLPTIGVELPVFYGSDDLVLGRGAGLLENTSYPGTEGGHSVISAHRGGHTQKFFLHLDRLQPGDAVYLEESDRVLKYVMTSSAVVWPTDTGVITLEPGRDLVTLLTCDPPPVNDHRLLVRTERAAITDAEIAAINPDLVPAAAVTAKDAAEVAREFAPRDLVTQVLTAWWLPLVSAVVVGLGVVWVVLVPRRRRRADRSRRATRS